MASITGRFLLTGSRPSVFVGAKIFRMARIKLVMVLIKLLSAILSKSFIGNLRIRSPEVFVEEIR